MKRILFFILLGMIVQSCATKPKYSFSEANAPTVPDYSQLSAWAAHPQKEDPSDSIPAVLAKAEKTFAAKDQIDVFFLHPTTYTLEKGNTQWNGPIDDVALNEKTDEGSILYQASIFNAVGQVYAPRYRQAHLESYFTDAKTDAKEAFELAYIDVKAAFEYYLEYHNNGRPFIIASHSQGTTHAKQLIKEKIDGKALQKQLIAAYIVGIPVEKDYFSQIQECQDSTDVQCFMSWRSYKKGKYPKWHKKDNNIVATNPLTWTTSTEYIPKSENLGGILLDFEEILPNLAGAQVHNGLLWLKKPKFKWSFLYWTPNYHAGDFNLYYLNVRQNTITRANAFLKEADIAP